PRAARSSKAGWPRWQRSSTIRRRRARPASAACTPGGERMIAALRWHEAPRRVQLAALSLPIVLVTTLLRALGLIDDLALLGYAALLVYVLAEWPRLPRINRLLLWIAFAALVLLPLLHPQPLSVLRQAFDRAAYYA